MYKIDVPTYHWDNDHFTMERKTLNFVILDVAKKAQTILRSLEFSEDELMCHWSVPSEWRNNHTHDIPMSNDKGWIYDRLGVYHGVIIKADFRIYTVVNMIEYVA